MQQSGYLMDEFYSLIDFIPLPTVILQLPQDPFADEPHVIHFVNKRFTEVMGYELAEIPDHNQWFRLAFPELHYRQEINQAWQKNINKPQDKAGDYLDSAVKVKCKNNDERWFKVYTELKNKIFPGLYLVTFCDYTSERENDQLHKICDSTDPQTNVANKHFILNSLDDEVARVNRFGDSFSLIIAHLDNLEDIEESYGQEGIDYVLKSVAGVLQTKVRKIDIISRWDDDKFLILIPKTNAEQAFKVNEIILEKIKSFPFRFKGTSISASVTIGIAEYQINENVKNTIERADSALYLGKASGNGYIVRPHMKNNYTLKSRFASKL